MYSELCTVVACMDHWTESSFIYLTSSQSFNGKEPKVHSECNIREKCAISLLLEKVWKRCSVDVRMHQSDSRGMGRTQCEGADSYTKTRTAQTSFVCVLRTAYTFYIDYK